MKSIAEFIEYLIKKMHIDNKRFICGLLCVVECDEEKYIEMIRDVEAGVDIVKILISKGSMNWFIDDKYKFKQLAKTVIVASALGTRYTKIFLNDILSKANERYKAKIKQLKEEIFITTIKNEAQTEFIDMPWARIIENIAKEELNSLLKITPINKLYNEFKEFLFTNQDETAMAIREMIYQIHEEEKINITEAKKLHRSWSPVYENKGVRFNDMRKIIDELKMELDKEMPSEFVSIWKPNN